MKKIKDMTNKELKEEWAGIEQHIKHFAYGKYELNYRDELEQEANKRGMSL